jgi:serine/threonine protein kinase
LAKIRPAAAQASGLTALATAPPELTGHGSILGTFQYMAPEQLEGQDADARTDIFAFGAVLYEMLTGRKAFEGKTQASLIASILDRQPPSVSSLQPTTPIALDRLLRACLMKDPADRIQSAHDIAMQLQWIAETPDTAATTAPQRTRPRLLMAATALLAATTIALAVSALRGARAPAAAEPIRFSVAAPPRMLTARSSCLPMAVNSRSPPSSAALARRFGFAASIRSRSSRFAGPKGRRFRSGRPTAAPWRSSRIGNSRRCRSTVPAKRR